MLLQLVCNLIWQHTEVKICVEARHLQRIALPSPSTHSASAIYLWLPSWLCYEGHVLVYRKISTTNVGKYKASMRDECCDIAFRPVLVNAWITWDNDVLGFPSAGWICPFELAIFKDRLSKFKEGSVAEPLCSEDVSAHRVQVFFSVHQGNEGSRTRNSVLFVVSSAGKRISFCASWVPTMDPTTSCLAMSTLCRFFPRAEIPSAINPSFIIRYWNEEDYLVSTVRIDFEVSAWQSRDYR
jgi:hypothetical protein